MIAGVAAGVADYLTIDVVVVRVAFVVLLLLGSVGVPLYAAAWLLIPEKGDDESLLERILQHAVDARPGRPGPRPSGTEMASAPGPAGGPQAGPVPEPGRSHDAAPS